jgi:hypothetical protein
MIRTEAVTEIPLHVWCVFMYLFHPPFITCKLNRWSSNRWRPETPRPTHRSIRARPPAVVGVRFVSLVVGVGGDFPYPMKTQVTLSQLVV